MEKMIKKEKNSEVIQEGKQLLKIFNEISGNNLKDFLKNKMRANNITIKKNYLKLHAIIIKKSVDKISNRIFAKQEK